MTTRAQAERIIDKQKLTVAQKKTAKKQLLAAIDIFAKKAKKQLPIGASRFGGIPDAPAGFEWPRAGGKWPMTFVAQFDLAEIAKLDRDERLPKKGLLSFFLHDCSPPKECDPE